MVRGGDAARGPRWLRRCARLQRWNPNPNPDPYPDPSPDPGPSPHQVREVAEEEFEVEATLRSLRGGAAASNTVEYTLRDAPKGAKYSCVEAAS